MSTATTSPTLAASRTVTGFRRDIEGLRAVAIGLVLVYHAGLPWITGGFVGVDVFFVISGFLITGLLLRELDRSGRVSLAAFYARRAKRLLPATAVVLSVTAVLTYAFLPMTQRRVFGGDLVSAATYVANWRFADRAVDYLAEGLNVSPVQHFWSLAVEEQFYLLWPVLIALCIWVARRRGRAVMPFLIAALTLVAVPSFIWSLVLTASSPASAFFVTTTRLWEMGIGAAIALAAPHLRKVPPRLGALLVACGVAAITASALCLDATSTWPGHLALIPTLGAAAVIIGGQSGGSRGVGTILESRFFVWVGGLSYSLYLWHWPILVAATAHWGGDLTAAQGLAVVSLSVIPAWLCHVLVENPLRFAPAMRSTPLALSMGASLTLVGVISGLVLALALPPTSTAPAGSAAPGADVVRLDPAAAGALHEVKTSEFITPSPAEATSDKPVSYSEGCQQGLESDVVKSCEYGDPESTTVIALAGDSKALQWQPVLAQIADERDWRLVVMTKSSCPFADAVTTHADDTRYTSCISWNAEALQQMLDLHPDVLLTSQNSAIAIDDPTDPESESSREAMEQALTSRWDTLIEADIPVLAVANNPTPDFEVYECVAGHLEDLSACAFADEAQGSVITQSAAVDETPGSLLLDLNDVICPDDMCPAVMGNVMVYRQGSHLTKTFVESSRAIFEPRLIEKLTALDDGTDW